MVYVPRRGRPRSSTNPRRRRRWRAIAAENTKPKPLPLVFQHRALIDVRNENSVNGLKWCARLLAVGMNSWLLLLALFRNVRAIIQVDWARGALLAPCFRECVVRAFADSVQVTGLEGGEPEWVRMSDQCKCELTKDFLGCHCYARVAPACVLSCTAAS